MKIYKILCLIALVFFVLLRVPEVSANFLLGNGDVDGNPPVNVLDLKTIIGNWLEKTGLTPGSGADQFGDNKINTFDFAVVYKALTQADPSQIPTQAPTPPSGTPPPYAQWPLCPTHDTTKWHALTDPARYCHYDHTHNDDPALGNDIFGLAGTLWGGSTISYPFKTSLSENTMKHGGYKYVVRKNIPCNKTMDFNAYSPVNCIKDVRIEYHTVGSMMDALSRFHSYYLEYNICARSNLSQCGIFRYGGWMDMGVLINPYPGTLQHRPEGTVNFGMGSKFGGDGKDLTMTFSADTPEMKNFHVVNDPYVAVTTFDGTAMGGNWFATQNYPNQARDVWSMGQFGFNQGNGIATNNPYGRFLVRSRDSWNLLPQGNLQTGSESHNPKWICSRDVNFKAISGQPLPNNCGYNNSVHSLNELTVRLVDMNTGSVLPPFANSVSTVNGIKVVNFNGYTDRYGQVVSDCSAVSLDCVPFKMTNVPLGMAAYSDDGDGNNADHEFDTSPPGKYWIQFPN